MGIETLFLYIVASFGLAFLLNRLDKLGGESFFDGIILSGIYIIILAGVFSSYRMVVNNDNIFLVVFLAILELIFYQVVILESPFFSQGEYYLKQYVFSLIFAYLVNIVFINQVDSVFLMGEELKILVWLLIGWYFFIKLKTDFKVKVPCRQEVLFYQNKEYIVIQYAKLKNQYKKVVTSSYIELVPVIYAMMIYENHEHSKLFRTIDHLKYRFFHEKGKFGIMQVYANYELTDEGSIQIAIRKLERIYSKCLKMNQSKEKAIEKVLQQYKGKSGKFIFSIYREIVLFDKE